MSFFQNQRLFWLFETLAHLIYNENHEVNIHNVVYRLHLEQNL